MSKKITPEEFEKTFLDIGKALKGDIDKVLQATSIKTFRCLVIHTPVDTGFLRSKWILQVGKKGISGETVKNPVKKKGKTGTVFNSAPLPSLKAKAGDTLTWYNNVEYASYVDQGTAKQRAQPIIQPCGIKMVNDLMDLSRRLKKKRIS